MVISVLTTFLTSFTVPYLIGAAYANLGAKLGYVYGGINVLMVIGVFFIVPELKSRSLEEIDQLFDSGVSLRKLGALETKKAEEMFEEEKKLKTDARLEVVGKS